MYSDLGVGDPQRQTHTDKLQSQGQAHVPKVHLTPGNTAQINLINRPRAQGCEGKLT